ncbi:hypothetical protein [[Phormidium ambiguum] IAM M-71]|nr:hypothetical protein [Phormidium ambiguum]
MSNHHHQNDQATLIELRMKAKQLMQIYGYPHPDYLAVLQQIKELTYF